MDPRNSSLVLMHLQLAHQEIYRLDRLNLREQLTLALANSPRAVLTFRGRE